MIIKRRKTLIILLTSFLAGMPAARAADWINFYPVEGEISLGFDGLWRDDDTGASTSQLETEERLKLQIGGYSLDPRLFSFNARLEPGLTQRTNDSGTQDYSSDGVNLNYAARFDFLSGIQASPFALSGNVAANSAELEGSLGNRSDVTTESRGASLRWKNRAFPMSLSYRERSLNQVFIPALGQPPTEHDEFQRTVTLQGRSRKMELFAEMNDYDDLLSVDHDYESQEARLSNFFRWGKGSYLTSRVGYLIREGFNESEKVNVNESLKIQHLENLYTSYGYSYEWLDRTFETETHRGDFELNHQLYQNLTTSLKLRGSNTNSDEFVERTYGGDLDLTYRKKIAPGVGLRMNAGSGYRVSEQDGGQLDFSESPTVPITGIVILAQRYILWPTIIVTAPACAPCVEGTDYLVEDAGGDYTQLSIPATSPISIGDVITVDYVYESPTVEYYAVPYRAGARLDFGWVAVYHNTSGENQTYVSGPDPAAVNDNRSDVTGIEFIWNGPRLRASAGAERKYTQTGNYSNLEYLLRQTLDYALAPNASLNANFTESFYRNGTSADAYRASLSANWIPFPGFSVNPNLEAFRRIQDPGGTENFVKAGVNLRWQWRRVYMDMRYYHSERDNDGRNTGEDRLMLNVKRKF